MRVTFIKLKERWRANPYSDPPLGLLSVIATARQKGLEVALVDMAHEDHIPPSDVYGMSASTLDFPELLKVAGMLRLQSPTAPIIVGGPHFDVISQREWEGQIRELPIDIICRGEGELALAMALKHLNDHPGAKTVITQLTLIPNLDVLPFPAIDLLDRSRYFQPGVTFGGQADTSGNSATMMTSRGCPFICSFCASPAIHHGRVRFRSPENVGAELRILCEEYGVSQIRFQDDCFTINDRRFKALTEVLKSFDIRYRCSMRVDQIDDATMDLLWDGGCREIGFGVESADDQVLELLHKKTTVELNAKALLMAKTRGFITRIFIMTGLPGETQDSADRMIEFLELTNPEVVTLTSFVPLPGSGVYMNPDRYGVRILHHDWRLYDISLKWESHIPFVHRIATATLEQMEANREKLKAYLFNRGKSHVKSYNKEYVAAA